MEGVLDKQTVDGNTLNSPPKIIIKKENIGLQEYQHRKYQYNLFNSIVKRDQYYEDLRKVKHRLARNIPNMQQVIHTDMKRINTNKVYERKLKRDINGPRGLDWQCKQELQRLANNERDIERDLIRLNRDLARIALLPPLGQSPLPDQNKELSQSQTPPLLFNPDTSLPIQTLQKTKLFFRRSFTVNSNRNTTANRFTPIIKQKRASTYTSNPNKEKSPWIHKQIKSKLNENRTMSQQKFNQFLH